MGVRQTALSLILIVTSLRFLKTAKPLTCDLHSVFSLVPRNGVFRLFLSKHIIFILDNVTSIMSGNFSWHLTLYLNMVFAKWSLKILPILKIPWLYFLSLSLLVLAVNLVQDEIRPLKSSQVWRESSAVKSVCCLSQRTQVQPPEMKLKHQGICLLLALVVLALYMHIIYILKVE